MAYDHEVIDVSIENALDAKAYTAVVSAVDEANNTLDVVLDEGGTTVEDVPIFYHCQNAKATVDSGYFAFQEDDEVLVFSPTGETPTALNSYVIGFKDGFPRECLRPFIVSLRAVIIYSATSIAYRSNLIYWDCKNNREYTGSLVDYDEHDVTYGKYIFRTGDAGNTWTAQQVIQYQGASPYIDSTAPVANYDFGVYFTYGETTSNNMSYDLPDVTGTATVANQAFTVNTGDGWTTSDATYTHSSGTDPLFILTEMTTTDSYRVQFYLSGVTSGSIEAQYGTLGTRLFMETLSADGFYYYDIDPAITSDRVALVPTNDFDGTVGGIRVRKVVSETVNCCDVVDEAAYEACFETYSGTPCSGPPPDPYGPRTCLYENVSITFALDGVSPDSKAAVINNTTTDSNVLSAWSITSDSDTDGMGDPPDGVEVSYLRSKTYECEAIGSCCFNYMAPTGWDFGYTAENSCSMIDVSKCVNSGMGIEFNSTLYKIFRWDQKTYLSSTCGTPDVGLTTKQGLYKNIVSYSEILTGDAWSWSLYFDGAYNQTFNAFSAGKYEGGNGQYMLYGFVGGVPDYDGTGTATNFNLELYYHDTDNDGPLVEPSLMRKMSWTDIRATLFPDYWGPEAIYDPSEFVDDPYTERIPVIAVMHVYTPKT